YLPGPCFAASVVGLVARGVSWELWLGGLPSLGCSRALRRAPPTKQNFAPPSGQRVPGVSRIQCALTQRSAYLARGYDHAELSSPSLSCWLATAVGLQLNL